MATRPKKIISQPFGGLGDWMLISTLPRRFTEAGFDVYLHEGPLTVFRNKEIEALVKANPYILGTTPDLPNAGLGIYIDTWGAFCMVTRTRPPDPIAIMEEVNGLGPPYEHLPEIPDSYYSINIEVQPDLVTVDPYSSSVPFTADSVDPWLTYYQQHYVNKRWTVVETPGYAAFHRSLFSYPKTRVQNIQDYVNLVRCSSAFFGVESGGQLLAAAIRRKRPDLKVHGLFSTRGFNQRFFTLPMNEVLYDVSCFPVQSDFAVDPGQLGWQHIDQTHKMAHEMTARQEAEQKAAQTSG